jgi:hypothetical protein
MKHAKMHYIFLFVNGDLRERTRGLLLLPKIIILIVMFLERIF